MGSEKTELNYIVSWKFAVGWACFCAVLALLLQTWVGDFTLYSKWRYQKHLVLHQAIIENTPPAGSSWHDMGANGVNIRVLVPLICESIHLLTGADLSAVYWHIDNIFLSATLFILFFWFTRFVPPVYAILGVSYYALATVCSYHFHYFHPWDRFTQFLWVCIAILLVKQKDLWLFCLLVVLMLAKPDALLFPLLYFALRVGRGRVMATFWRAVLLQSVLVTTVLLLNFFLPGGIDRPNMGGWPDLLQFVSNNARTAWELLPGYPPFLVLAFPVLLACLQSKLKTRQTTILAMYGLLVLVPYVFLANLQEVRAFLYVLTFILPSALCSVRIFLEKIPTKPRHIKSV